MKDVAIVGAGPIGLFAVFELGMLGLSAALIDGLSAVGGQCRVLYPEKPIFDIPAWPAIKAGELVDQLWAQASPFQPELHLGAAVESVERVEGGFVLSLGNGHSLAARTVLVAAGGGAFAPNRPPLPGIEAFENISVLYFVDQMARFKDRRVVIAGGGDSAVDWANILADGAASVSLVHRRSQFRAAPAAVAELHEKAARGKITLRTPAQLSGLQGKDGHLASVDIAYEDGRRERIEADFLLPFFGLIPSLGSIEAWGLDLDKKTIRVDQGTCATNLPGVFAIGDIAAYPHKLKLIMTGFAEAAQAAHAIYRHIHPGKELHFVHSTDKGVTGLPQAG